MPIDVNEMKIDCMSLSGHKVYGPKGVGAMYLRRRPRVRLEAQMSGGGQERGLRSGTLAPALVVGMGAACEVAQQEMENDERWITYLSDKLYQGITERMDHVTLNGDKERRYPGNLNLSFAFVEGESMLMALKNLAVSSGSACTSASLEPSYVLRALGESQQSPRRLPCQRCLIRNCRGQMQNMGLVVGVACSCPGRQVAVVRTLTSFRGWGRCGEFQRRRRRRPRTFVSALWHWEVHYGGGGASLRADSRVCHAALTSRTHSRCTKRSFL